MFVMLFLKFDLNKIIFIICAVIAIIIVTFLICLILKRNSKANYLNKVDEMLKEINVVNTPQLEAYISRLNNIASNNDEFVDIYTQLSAQYEILMNTDKEKLLVRQRGLKERLLSEKKIKKPLLEQIKSLENAISLYKKDVLRIKNDLESFFKDGDELRVRLTNLQDKYQQINSEIEKYSSSLSICKNELLNYLADIEMYFDVFDNNIAGARYKEASKNLDTIENHILNVYGHIETIAQFCNMVETIIPQQIADLLNKNNDLEKQGYVVSHAKVNEFVDNTKKLLEECKIQFQHLCFGDFEELSYQIQSKFSEVHAHLDQEVSSKKELNKKYKIVDEKIVQVESEFIKTKRQFHTMLEYYKLPQDIYHKFEIFEKNATMLSDLKREYEGYLFVNAKNPASFMLEKVSKMDNIAKEILDDITFFINYFKDIKEYVEQTYEKEKTLTIDLIKTIGQVRFNKSKNIYYKYIEKVNNCILQLKKIDELLLAKPIDIATLNQNFSSIVSASEDLKIAIINELDSYILVEKCIVFANPLRCQFSNVDASLNEIELLFKKGEYNLAQEKLNDILNNYHPAAFEAFK